MKSKPAPGLRNGRFSTLSSLPGGRAAMTRVNAFKSLVLEEEQSMDMSLK